MFDVVLVHEFLGLKAKFYVMIKALGSLIWAWFGLTALVWVYMVIIGISFLLLLRIRKTTIPFLVLAQSLMKLMYRIFLIVMSLILYLCFARILFLLSLLLLSLKIKDFQHLHVYIDFESYLRHVVL